MTALRLRWVRVALVVSLTLAVLAELGWSGALRGHDGVIAGFEDVSLDETVFAAVAETGSTLSVRRVWVDTVGPIAVEAVRCPDVLLGSDRSCAGGPVAAVGTPMQGSLPDGLATFETSPDARTGDGILALAVTRTGPGPAAVCGTRILYTAGWRAGVARSQARIELPDVDDDLPAGDEPSIADMLCN